MNLELLSEEDFQAWLQEQRARYKQMNNLRAYKAKLECRHRKLGWLASDIKSKAAKLDPEEVHKQLESISLQRVELTKEIVSLDRFIRRGL